MRINIKKKYVYVYLAICVAFIAFYIFLFVLNRMGYAQDALDSLQDSASKEVSEVVILSNYSMSQNLRYFVDFAQSLEYFHKKDKSVVNYLVRENSLYFFFGLLKNGSFSVTNNNSFIRFIPIKEISEIRRIEVMYIPDKIHKKTFRVIVYPVFVNGKLDSHLVAYSDITSILKSHNVYFTLQDGKILNNMEDSKIFHNNLSYEYPNEWDRISRVKEGQFVSDSGVFTFHALDETFNIDEINIYLRRVYILSISPFENHENPYLITNFGAFLENTDFTTNIAYWIVAAIWMFLTSIVALLVISNMLYNNDRAKYDNLTGTYNRMFGYEKIRQTIAQMTNPNPLQYLLNKLAFFNRGIKSVHFCMVDIDGLKEVNDTLGHKHGDRLITSITEIISQDLRRNEFIVRMGGDEFLVVFLNRDARSIDNYWDSIYQEFGEQNAKVGAKYLLNVSHGIAKYELGDNIEACIERADEQMYKEKRMRKVDLFFT